MSLDLQVVVQVACLHPFLEAPRLQLRYICGTRQVVQELALPLAPHKFMLPDPHISKEVFFDKWKAYPGAQLLEPLVLYNHLLVTAYYITVCMSECLVTKHSVHHNAKGVLT